MRRGGQCGKIRKIERLAKGKVSEKRGSDRKVVVF
jgi:hypothetical protein